MEYPTKLKVFISYSHKNNQKDKAYIEQFKTHLAPLKNNGLIEEWYDRKIIPGKDFQSIINNNLAEADIICLFISAEFLDSENCMNEKKAALELMKTRGIAVISIILSPCGWLDDKDISKFLALPTDGKSITSYQDINEGWMDTYNGLKKIIENKLQIKELTINGEFQRYLHDTEILTKAHSQKESVYIDDIFIYPEFEQFDDLKEHKGRIDSKEIINKVLDHPKIVLAGESQSGKTTFCKILFNEFRKLNFVPVLVSLDNGQPGRMEHLISRSFSQQYEGVDLSKIEKVRIVPIVDDFQFSKRKDKVINELSDYTHQILVVDDIFGVNIKNVESIKQYEYFKIRELKASLRYELIKKWTHLTNKNQGGHCSENEFYKDVDKNTELINNILGKVIGRGVLPAYPFFILSAIVAYEAFMPLDQEISSQGYCYQALIYFYLRKMGVRNEDIDTYINFLTELSFYFHRENKCELSSSDIDSFIGLYLGKYNLTINKTVILENLSDIISQDSLSYYSFRYKCLYYFFVAKYLAEHIEDVGIEKKFSNIIQNLHVNENAYIAISIAHHSKNAKIIDTIELNALCLFDGFPPATLTKDEVSFFDSQVDSIVKAALPPSYQTPESKRYELLKTQDDAEQLQEKLEKDEDDKKNHPLEQELRRAIKTVEVIGCIIKNRSGSIEKTKLEEMFKEAMCVHLRILSSFFHIIRSEDQQQEIINYISKKVEKIIQEKEKEPSREKLEDISRKVFWNLNFFVVFGIVHKIIVSLGSDKLLDIISNVCKETDTPASFAVSSGIKMWYSKTLGIDDISKRSKKKDFSMVAERLIKLLVVNHCSLHPLNYRDRQRIENELNIPTIKFLKNYHKDHKSS